MVEAGIIGDGDRVELVDGELLEMSPQDPVHASIVSRLTRLLLQSYGSNCCVRVQLPLAAGRTDLPEPDLAVAKGSESAYVSRHPGGLDCLLVVEVCRSSEARDRRKAAVYAAAGVPAFWLIDVARNRVEVHQAPDATAGYTQVAIFSGADAVPLPERPGSTLPARALLTPTD